jgi:hypothetical protein
MYSIMRLVCITYYGNYGAWYKTYMEFSFPILRVMLSLLSPITLNSLYVYTKTEIYHLKHVWWMISHLIMERNIGLDILSEFSLLSQSLRVWGTVFSCALSPSSQKRTDLLEILQRKSDILMVISC